MPTLYRSNQPALHYEIDDYTDPWKNAPFILLQHGYGRSAKFWYRWVPYLSRFYKVVRPDLRGLGQSSKDFDLRQGISVDAYLADIEDIIDEVGAESVHYCGESLGGILGMAFAATRPDRVRTLNLISAPVFLDDSFKNRSRFGYGSWEEALRKLGPQGYAEAKNSGDRFSPDTDPGLMQWFADEQGKSDVEVLIAMQHLASRVDATPYLRRITSPVLAIYPSQGPITTPEQEDAASEIRKELEDDTYPIPASQFALHAPIGMCCSRSSFRRTT